MIFQYEYCPLVDAVYACECVHVYYFKLGPVNSTLSHVYHVTQIDGVILSISLKLLLHIVFHSFYSDSIWPYFSFIVRNIGRFHLTR